MEHLVWCAIAGRQNLFQVDISLCKVVYDLQKAVAEKTRYKVFIPRLEIWKVCSQRLVTSYLHSNFIASQLNQINGRSMRKCP